MAINFNVSDAASKLTRAETAEQWKAAEDNYFKVLKEELEKDGVMNGWIELEDCGGSMVEDVINVARETYGMCKPDRENMRKWLDHQKRFIETVKSVGGDARWLDTNEDDLQMVEEYVNYGTVELAKKYCDENDLW